MIELNFGEVARKALLSSRSVIEHFLPGGKYEGTEYVALNPVRADKRPGSFKVNIVKGVWSDFADDAGGNDLISLIAYTEGVSQGEAARKIMVYLGEVTVRPQVVATFAYRDEKGKPIYYKERLEPGRDGKRKEFRFYHKDGNKRVSGRGKDKVLYNLPGVLKAKAVIFVEGEAKADLLISWGLTATCLDSGSKSKLTAEMVQQLADKRVVILPDNDDPGRDYAEYLVSSLTGKAEGLKIVPLPGLQEKEDIIQWAALPGNNREKLVDLIRTYSPKPVAAELVTTTPAKQPAGRRRRNDEEKPERVPQAEIILMLMEGMPLLVDDTKTPWTYIDGKTIPVQSQELSDWLTLKYFRLDGRAPSSEALSSAVKVLAARARIEGEKIALFNRIAKKDGDFWYDLGEGRAVRISPDGWEFVEPPPLFQRWSHQQPQPDPVPAGDPWKFFRFCHLPEENHLLAMTTLITSFIPGIAHPLWHVTGPQGAGKSSFCRFIKLLVDPSAAELQIMQPQKETDFYLTLYQNYILVLDNLSDLSSRISDVLCGAATGTTVSQRALYSNMDLVLLRLKNVVILNGITPLIHRADLMDRTITITLGRIPPEGRREEREVFEEFERELPGILGGILDVVSKAMKIYPDVKLSALPRMADFARWGYAVAEALGGYGDRFIVDYTANGSLQNEEILGHNALANALILEMEDKTKWETTVGVAWSALLEKAKPPHGDKTFPAKSQDLRRHLERLRVSLAEEGITFDYGRRTREGVAIVFYRRDVVSSSPEASSSPYVHGHLHTSNKLDLQIKEAVAEGGVNMVNMEATTSSTYDDFNVFLDAEDFA